MLRRLVAAGVLCVAVLFPLRAGAAERVTIDPEVRHQTIEGWGTCLYGSDAARAVYRDERFLRAYRDAGFNVVRMPMVKEVLVHDSGDFSRPVRLGDDLDANVGRMNFHAGPLDDYAAVATWLRENGELPIVVTGDVWSPPHWMKGPTGLTSAWVGNPAHDSPKLATPWLSNTANSWMNGRTSPTGDSIGGRLRTEDPEILRQYGRYLAAWVVGFERAHGVAIDAISLQNESTFENPFDSMTFAVGADGQRDTAQYAMGLKAIKDAWRRFGLTTKVMGPHVAGLGPTPENPFKSAPQLGMIEGVRNHRDRELLAFLDYYNANYYVPATEAGARATAAYLHGTAAVPAAWGKDWGVAYVAEGTARDGKPYWYSETGDPASPWRGKGGGVVELPIKVFNALVHGGAVAYVYWQMADGGAEATGSTLIGTRDLDDPLGSKKYATMCQFSRFVPPGSVRVRATFDNGDATTGGNSEYDTANALNVVAFETPDNGRTIVLLNMTREAIEVELPGDATYATYLTDAEHSLASFDDRAGRVRVPASAVVTLVRR